MYIIIAKEFHYMLRLSKFSILKDFIDSGERKSLNLTQLKINLKDSEVVDRALSYIYGQLH